MRLPPKKLLAATAVSLCLGLTAAVSSASALLANSALGSSAAALARDQRGALMLTNLCGFGTLNPAYIKSIQQVSITVAASSASNTATITGVDIAHSFIVFDGILNSTGASTVLGEVLGHFQLTNTTTVTLTRNGSPAGIAITGKATVIECTGELVQSVAQGTIALSTAQTSNTATITSIDTSRTAIIWLGNLTAAIGSNYNSGHSNVTITNSTTITLARNITGSVTLTGGYVAIQFNKAVIHSLQQITLTSIAAVNTETTTFGTTLGSISNTIAFYNGLATASNTAQNGMWDGTITNTTTFTYDRSGASSTSTRTHRYTVVEFEVPLFKSIQRGSITLAAAASNTATITSVVTTKSFVNYLNFKTLDASGTYNNFNPALDLTSATVVTLTKGAAGVSTIVGTFEVFEFN